MLTQELRNRGGLLTLRLLAVQLSLQLPDTLAGTAQCPELAQLVDDLADFAIAHDGDLLPDVFHRKDLM